MSEQLGITTDSLQALEYAGKGAGVSGDQLQMVWQKLSVAAAEASDKNSSSAKALEKLGISTQAFLGLPLDRQLEAIAKASANAADKNTAFAAVADLIGAKNAPRLNVVLQQLADGGFDKLTASARAAGQIIESSTIKQFDDLGDRVSILKTKLETFGSKLLAGVFNFAEGLGAFAATTLNMIDGISTDYGEVEQSANLVNVALEKGNVLLAGTKATAEDLKRLEEAKAKLVEKGLSDSEKQNYWLEQYTAKIMESLKYQKDSKEYLTARTEAEGFLVKIADQRIAAEKKAAEEAKKNAEDLEQFQRKQTDFDREKLSNTQKMKALKADEKKLVGELADYEAGSAGWIETSTRLLEVRGKIRDAEKSKMEDQTKLAELLLIPETQRTDLQKEQIKLLTEQTTKAKQNAEILLLNASLIAGTITPAEKARLEVLIGTVQKTEETTQHLDAQKELGNLLLISEKDRTDEIRKRIFALQNELGLVMQIHRVGKNYREQDTENLEYVKAQLMKQLVPLQNEKQVYGYSPGLAAVEKELANLKTELDARTKFGNIVNGQGADFAQRIYSPDMFERLMRTIHPPETQTKIADTLGEINGQLKSIFGK